MSDQRPRPVRDESRDDSHDDDVDVIEDVSVEEDEYEARTIKGYRERRLRIEFGGSYKGTWVEVWTNCPRRVIKRLVSDDPDEVDEAFCQFVLDHNFEYADGVPLPSPLTVEALEDLDQTLFIKTVKLGVEAMQKAAGVGKR